MTKIAMSPAPATPISDVMGDIGDCVAVGHGVGAVVGALVVFTTAAVVGTMVIAGVAGPSTRNVLVPIYPFASVNMTS